MFVASFAGYRTPTVDDAQLFTYLSLKATLGILPTSHLRNRWTATENGTPVAEPQSLHPWPE